MTTLVDVDVDVSVVNNFRGGVLSIGLRCPEGPTQEICDGLDNDCDGQVDENNPGGGVACSTGLPGVCAAGTTACVSGAAACVSNVPASAEVCDGLDNDCDGQVDDGLGTCVDVWTSCF